MPPDGRRNPPSTDARRTGRRPGASVLGVGCGTGYFTRHLATDGLEVTGIDPDSGMIHYAQSYCVAGERYLVADARGLLFPDDCF